MLPLLLMVLLSAAVLSQPIQQDCSVTEAEFRDCIRETKVEVAVPYEDEFKKYTELFDKCGVYKSDCYLHQKLAAIITRHKELKKEFPDVDENARACVNELYIGSVGKECQKTTTYDEHGFRRIGMLNPGWGAGDSNVELKKLRCLAERAKESQCSSEGTKLFEQRAELLEMRKDEEDVLGFYNFVLHGYDL